MLRIGEEKGNVLSAQEIKDFLEVIIVNKFNKNDQYRIICFMKSLKEGQGKPQKTPVIEMLCSDYKNFKHEKTNCTSDFISYANRYFVLGVSQCEKPETFARVAEITGCEQNVAEAANALSDIYELSNGNAALVLDLGRVFHSPEIKQIGLKLKETGFNADSYKFIHTQQDYGHYTNVTLKEQRKNVLDSLDISDEIKLYPLPHYVDIMHTKRYDGNYEGGKRC